jgi:hydroxyethylthiazole kinase
LISSEPPTIIRGNASEIMALFDEKTKTKGVDSAASSDDAVAIAKKISAINKCVVCVSGETDYVVDDDKVIKIQNGHPLMTRVTGLGCTSSALCGAFAAVENDAQVAVAQAMAVMGIVGEMAVQKADGPGSLQMHFLDILYSLSQDDISQRLKIEE